MCRVVTWYYLLNKRLLKKPSFLLILCLVPLLAAGMRLAAQGESGVLTIALYAADPEDGLTSEIMKELTEADSVLRYIVCASQEEARELVERYQADAAWIFPADLEEKLREAAARGAVEPAVSVVQREDTVFLMFTREILSKKIYPFLSYEIYEDFVKKELGLEAVSDGELREAYERTLVEGSFFQLEYPDGQPEENDSYLLTPVRGILAVWFVLCGFAASLYFIQDEQRGTYSRMPVASRLRMAFGAHAVLLSDAAVVLLLACRLAGVFTQWQREIISAFLFACCTTAFSNLVRLLCRTPERLGSCMPVLLLGMLVLCPVFLNIKRWKAVQYLLPPNFYLKSIHSVSALYGMAVYALIVTGLCVLISRLRQPGKG